MMSYETVLDIRTADCLRMAGWTILHIQLLQSVKVFLLIYTIHRYLTDTVTHSFFSYTIYRYFTDIVTIQCCGHTS